MPLNGVKREIVFQDPELVGEYSGFPYSGLGVLPRTDVGHWGKRSERIQDQSSLD